MKKYLKISVLLLTATFLTFSACKKKDENPANGSCHISIESGSQFSDTITYDNDGRPVSYVYFDTYSATPFLWKMNFYYNSLNQIIKAALIIKTSQDVNYLFNYDNKTI